MLSKHCVEYETQNAGACTLDATLHFQIQFSTSSRTCCCGRSARSAQHLQRRVAERAHGLLRADWCDHSGQRARLHDARRRTCTDDTARALRSRVCRRDRSARRLVSSSGVLVFHLRAAARTQRARARLNMVLIFKKRSLCSIQDGHWDDVRGGNLSHKGAG